MGGKIKTVAPRLPDSCASKASTLCYENTERATNTSSVNGLAFA